MKKTKIKLLNKFLLLGGVVALSSITIPFIVSCNHGSTSNDTNTPIQPQPPAGGGGDTGTNPVPPVTPPTKPTVQHSPKGLSKTIDEIKSGNFITRNNLINNSAAAIHNMFVSGHSSLNDPDGFNKFAQNITIKEINVYYSIANSNDKFIEPKDTNKKQLSSYKFDVSYYSFLTNQGANLLEKLKFSIDFPFAQNIQGNKKWNINDSLRSYFEGNSYNGITNGDYYFAFELKMTSKNYSIGDTLHDLSAYNGSRYFAARPFQ